MQKKMFGFILSAVLMLSMSTIVFASNSNTQHDEFERMGLRITGGDMPIIPRNHAPFDMSAMEICVQTDSMIIPNHYLITVEAPRISRANENAEVVITENDINIIMNFVYESANRGMPISMDSHFVQALEEAELDELFLSRMREFSSINTQGIAPLSFTRRHIGWQIMANTTRMDLGFSLRNNDFVFYSLFVMGSNMRFGVINPSNGFFFALGASHVYPAGSFATGWAFNTSPGHFAVQSWGNNTGAVDGFYEVSR